MTLLLWLLLGAIGFATLAAITLRPPADEPYDWDRSGL